MKISLILATIGRKIEVNDFLNSINNSQVRKFDVEVIVVDQNKDSSLDEIISQAKKTFWFDIIHVKSDILGLSANRNIGLSRASGDVFGFPDDDCLYYPDTLLNVACEFSSKSSKSMIIGRIYSRELSENIIKKWPIKRKAINKVNFYQYSSSITMFSNCADMKFDERLGAGSFFGSCEDPDYIYKHLQQRIDVLYTPSIEVWHPTPEFSNICNKKVRSYSSGFGFFIANNFDFYTFSLLVQCVVLKAFQAVFVSGRYKKGYFKNFFKGLYNGLFNRR